MTRFPSPHFYSSFLQFSRFWGFYFIFSFLFSISAYKSKKLETRVNIKRKSGESWRYVGMISWEVMGMENVKVEVIKYKLGKELNLIPISHVIIWEPIPLNLFSSPHSWWIRWNIFICLLESQISFLSLDCKNPWDERTKFVLTIIFSFYSFNLFYLISSDVKIKIWIFLFFNEWNFPTSLLWSDFREIFSASFHCIFLLKL